MFMVNEIFIINNCSPTHGDKRHGGLNPVGCYFWDKYLPRSRKWVCLYKKPSAVAQCFCFCFFLHFFLLYLFMRQLTVKVFWWPWALGVSSLKLCKYIMHRTPVSSDWFYEELQQGTCWNFIILDLFLICWKDLCIKTFYQPYFY